MSRAFPGLMSPFPTPHILEPQQDEDSCHHLPRRCPTTSREHQRQNVRQQQGLGGTQTPPNTGKLSHSSSCTINDPATGGTVITFECRAQQEPPRRARTPQDLPVPKPVGTPPAAQSPSGPPRCPTPLRPSGVQSPSRTLQCPKRSRGPRSLTPRSCCAASCWG